MKKITLIMFLGLLLPCNLYCADKPTVKIQEARVEVWRSFHKVRVALFKGDEWVVMYAESPDLSKIAFICKDGLYIYHHKDPNYSKLNHISRVVHAKSISYKNINRITSNKNNGFTLWSYQSAILSF